MKVTPAASEDRRLAQLRQDSNDDTDDPGQGFPGRGQGFCLVMKLRYPAQMGELLKGVEKFKGKDGNGEINKRLNALKYVHYSRFVPLIDRGVLLIVTEFDGDQKDYVMDFAAVLDREFSFILSFMEDAPPLPVGEHPKAFYAYVERNTKLLPGQTAGQFRPVGPLDGRSVLDVLGDDVYAAHNPDDLLPKEMSSRNGKEASDWKSDVQGNIVKGFAATRVRHYFLRFKDSDAGAALLVKLSDLMAADGRDSNSHCLNIGLTFEGLRSLGLPHDHMRRFPVSFQRGPSTAERGFVPGTWPTQFTQEGGRQAPVHAIVSLSMRGDGASAMGSLEQMLKELAGKWSSFDGQRIDGEMDSSRQGMVVHFGLLDGISQPRIKGVEHRRRETGEGDSLPGDFLLGHPNSRGGSYIGELPEELAQNGSYSAFLVVDQDVQEFEERATWAVDPPMHLSDTEKATLYSEKLLGRKADGCPMHTKEGKSLNDFDFWATPSDDDADQRGQVCPFGAHIRRMNPRRGVVVGVPAGRRIIRRGMPFGPRFDSGRPDDAPRGLVGHFFCGDLEDQYEFLQKVWGTGDVSAPGLAGTRDPFAGSRSGNTPFRFTWSPDGSAPTTYTLTVPPLVSTRFAAYLFMPGRQGLQWIAKRSWAQSQPPARRQRKQDRGGSGPQTDPSRVGSRRQALAIETLDPLDRRFMQTPHRYYAALRSKSPVITIEPPYEGYWALSYGAVKDALACPTIVKPGLGRGEAPPRPESVTAGLKDGLFFQDPERHAAVRPRLDPAFPADSLYAAGSTGAQGAPGAGAAAHARITKLAQAKADELLALADARGVFDIVSEFAAPLTSHVFMEAMGIPLDAHGAERRLVDTWVRAALDGHDKAASKELRGNGLTASLALRAYFSALEKCPVQGVTQSTIMDAIRGNTGARGAKLTSDEAMNTALHFALGGFLSTQFLITTGVYNLLLHPSQWGQLKEDRSADLMNGAIDEMLRYDSPFMMADRWVQEDVELHGVKLRGASRLTLVYGSANRDPEAFDAPETFSIAAKRKNKHLAFGADDSQYNCIGKYMARCIASVAFRSLLDRFPDASIAEIGPWLTDPYYRSLTRLTLYPR